MLACGFTLAGFFLGPKEMVPTRARALGLSAGLRSANQLTYNPETVPEARGNGTILLRASGLQSVFSRGDEHVQKDDDRPIRSCRCWLGFADNSISSWRRGPRRRWWISWRGRGLSRRRIPWWWFPRRGTWHWPRSRISGCWSLWSVRLSLWLWLSLWLRRLRLRRWWMLFGPATSDDAIRLAFAPGPGLRLTAID